MFGISNIVNLIPDLLSDHSTMLYNASPFSDQLINMFQCNSFLNNHDLIIILRMGGLKHPFTWKATSPYWQ
jgi:hypothetical protein